MTLVLQLAAVVAAGVFASLAFYRRPDPAGVARALVVIAGALAYIVFWGHLSQTVDGFRSERVLWRSTPPEQAAHAGAPTEPGFQAGFAEWIRERMPPGSRFYLVPSPTRDDAVYQWFTYRLLPSLESFDRRNAEWLVFYGTTPAEAGLAHELDGPPLRFADGYSIARRRAD